MTESIFIISNGPKVPKEARTTIRKQAMRDVGLARKARGYGRINLRQGVQYADSHEGSIPFRSAVGMTLSRSSSTTLSSRSSSRAPAVRTPNTSQPSTVNWDEFVEAIPREDVADDYANDQSAMSCNLILPGLSPMPDYERARSKFGIDLMSLSILTNFNVGKSTIAILSADPTRLASLLNLAQWSYLEYVPERYGISECLTAATNCLLAKSAMDADVLCATQLLSLHELLDPSRDTAWSHHVQGSARLVRHRSATRFHTDFERALFAAHVGGIVSECLVNNMHCYLEQREWIGLYTSLTIESNFLSERSPLAISLRVTMFELPGIWHDVGEAVNGTDFYSDWPLAALEARCRKAHQELLAWLEQYKAHCVRLSLAQPPASELSLRRELFGSALECLAIVKRLLCTVCESDRRNLEVETQALAHLILDLQKQPSPKHSWLFSGHEVGVAYTVLLTKDQWEENVDRRDAHDKKVATKTRYNTWSNTLRMTG
ncbi:hypothetical protein LTR56_008970 [Elasticomyces elasticus]|nr:hypothetical protein LTR56_008970 [Elasticomyces elasticus]